MVSQGKQWKHLPRSIALRVIDYQIRGFRPSAIVTNLNGPRAVSRDQWMSMASQSHAARHLNVGLYHRRWEIETTFFELKVRQGMEGKSAGEPANASSSRSRDTCCSTR